MSDKNIQTRPAVVQAFVPGGRAHDQVFGDMTFWTRSAGDLIAPTGRIVACDPLYCIGAPAFVREVPPGRYPVLLALAQFTQDGDKRIAAAMLRLRDARGLRVFGGCCGTAGSHLEAIARALSAGDPAPD